LFSPTIIRIRTFSPVNFDMIVSYAI